MKKMAEAFQIDPAAFCTKHTRPFAKLPRHGASHCPECAIEERDESDAEIERLRARLLTAAGDDLCRLTQEEIKAMGVGAIPIPPKDEFLASCERFHAQVASDSGVNHNCLTLAQLVAENEHLRQQLAAAKQALEACTATFGHNHWDYTMQHGYGCQLCIAQRAAFRLADKALAAIGSQP
jgi:hypothetical protein